MSSLNLLFRKRIGFSHNENIHFENLSKVLENAAKTIPFENLRIINQTTTEITKENLMNKILIQNEGGLCYELNSILNLFLIENGFKATLFRGGVYDHMIQQWSVTGKTHAANLINHNGQQYIVDTGFAGNLPLTPVPLNGEIVTTNNGEFRVDKIESEHGDYIFYMKLKHKDKDWKIGYAFDSKEGTINVTHLNEIKSIIMHHPKSSFNKKPIVNRLTDKGSLLLTKASFIEWIDGKVNKKEIDEKQFKEIAMESFGLSLY